MNAKRIGDIDIDLPNGVDKGKYGIRAIIYDDQKLKIRPHPSGYYIDNNIPVDNETGMCAMDYKETEEAGFFKVDLLNASAYNAFKSKDEVLKALENPDWSLLTQRKVIEGLPQIGKHVELVQSIAPKDIVTLSDIITLIRPDKKHLIELYIKNKEKARKNLYTRGEGGYQFKRSHSIAYAHQIVCVMSKHNVKGLLVYR